MLLRDIGIIKTRLAAAAGLSMPMATVIAITGGQIARLQTRTAMEFAITVPQAARAFWMPMGMVYATPAAGFRPFQAGATALLPIAAAVTATASIDMAAGNDSSRPGE